MATYLQQHVSAKTEASSATITLSTHHKDPRKAIPPSDHRVVLIKVGSVIKAAEEIEPKVNSMMRLITPIAACWNEAIDKATISWGKEQLITAIDDANIDSINSAGCPLQQIKVHEKEFDAGQFVFTHAIKSKLKEQPALRQMDGTQAAAKSLAHLWSMVARVVKHHKTGSNQKDVAVWGALNAKCPCAWLPEPVGCLVMYSPKLSQRLAQSVSLKRAFVAACAKVLDARQVDGQPNS